MSIVGTKSRSIDDEVLDTASDPVPLYAKVAGTGDPQHLLRDAIEDLERLKRCANDHRRKQIDESLRLLRSFLAMA